MHFDINLNDFNALLKEASMQVLPLTSMRSAGLIGLITVAMLAIQVITTNTLSIQNYIQNDKSGILVTLRDYFALGNAIERLYNDFKLCRSQFKALLKQIIVSKFILKG